jgi:hypothetical protein
MKKKLVLLAALAAAVFPAFAESRDEQVHRWWLGAGLGMSSLKSDAPAPSAGRDGLDASVEVGYRLTPQLGLGIEFGALVPVDGCADWQCAGTPAAFAPRFTRIMAFGEFRPRDSGWRFRAGAGLSRFCYSRHWSDTGWSFVDTLDVLLSLALDDDLDETITGSGAYVCDARMKALGGAVSAGYDWPVSPGKPVSVGLRLSAEAADFGATRAIGLPAFRHRAVTLSLHLNFN